AAGAAWRILDVRTAREWDSGHIPGATHIPLGHLPGRLEELRGDSRPLAVHCQSGARSAIAASLLRQAGFADVVDLGPFPAWVKAGFEVEKGVPVPA
ncbi:MAG: rhodanese-like domain-containing protein, partial [Candidatus Eremiobacterota bacterium]